MQYQQNNPQGTGTGTDTKFASQIAMFLSNQQNPQQAQNHLSPNTQQYFQGQQASVLMNPTNYHIQQTVQKQYSIPQQKTATIPSQSFINPSSLSNTIYSNATNIPHIKQEPADDPFSNIQNNCDFGITDPANMMSPLPGSPLDISPEFDAIDEFTPRGSNSLANSPYGTSPSILSQPVNIVGSNHYRNPDDAFYETIPQINSATATATAINMKNPATAHLDPNFGGGLYSMSMPVNGTTNFRENNNYFTQPSSYGSYAGDICLKSSSYDFLDELDGNSKQLEILNEKRRRRRESHNAVERRRRDNINEKIHELSTLIPENILNPGNGEGTIGKPNKGIILRKSVEYIKHLQVMLEKQESRNKELEKELQKLKDKNVNTSANPEDNMTIE